MARQIIPEVATGEPAGEPDHALLSHVVGVQPQLLNWATQTPPRQPGYSTVPTITSNPPCQSGTHEIPQHSLVQASLSLSAVSDLLSLGPLNNAHAMFSINQRVKGTV